MEQRAHPIPGVYRETARDAEDRPLRTGVPVFLALVRPDAPAPAEPVAVLRPSQLAARVPGLHDDGLTAPAIAGFFANGGQRCGVLAIPTALDAAGLSALPLRVVEATRRIEADDDHDLLAAPDLMLALAGGPGRRDAVIAAQAELVRACTTSRRRIAVLDGPSAEGKGAAEVILDHALRLRAAIVARDPGALRDCALYAPWVQPGGARFIPPSGHVLGAIASTDAREGVHRAPAGISLEGVIDLGAHLDDRAQAPLLDAGVNCLRAFRGRGLRIWGARTLSDDLQWRPLSVRRLMLTIGRWLELALSDLTLEPNDTLLWNRVVRRISDYLDGLFAAGALRGKVAAEGYYVKCDAETNPPEVRDAGMMVAEVGVAPLVPQEFIALRLVQRGGGPQQTGAGPG